MLLSELFYRNTTYSKNNLKVNAEMNEIQILSIFYNIFNDNGEKNKDFYTPDIIIMLGTCKPHSAYNFFILWRTISINN